MPNHLAGSPSPYLRQHADNPVDWYPWGEEALARARREDRPILLSIGYSACHWCHVMAHECFEDEETAAVMNAHFINIKVDREERPDLDQIYQSAHQLLTRRPGGWPLTVFLTPDQSPFYAGTYFPKTPRYGLPGFADLLGQIVAAYRERRGEILKQNAVMLEVLARLGQGQGKGALPDAPQAVKAAMDFFRNHFDRENGGLGSAPKFPQASDQRFLLCRAWQDDAQAAEMAHTTLTHMALGGIYDQLGGGFFRYSVDAQWQIPHFEKMLYDNGQLLALYADAWALFREPVYARILRETVAWLEREMAAPDGGFYSAMDADSTGGEGAFYVWDREEWQRLLTADEYAVAALHYGLLQPPNFEGVHWHPHVAHPLTEVAERLRIDVGHAQELQEAARRKLYAARDRRQWPAVDDKILCAWNALAAQGLARAGRALGEASWIDAAHRTVDFLRERFWRDGRLHAAYHGGRAYLDAYLDDHAFLLDALLEVLQARFRPEDLDFARDLADAMLARFMDPEGGGFWFTAADHEPLVARMKSAQDNAMPSGNGVAVFALQRLGHLLGENRYLQAAESAFKAFAGTLGEHPASSATLSAALEEFDHPPQVLILRGSIDGLAGLQGAMAEHRMRPDLFTVAIPEGVAGLPEALDKPVKGMACAWLCRGNSCLPPIHTAEALRAALGR